jgi:hypothetical protein
MSVNRKLNPLYAMSRVDWLQDTSVNTDIAEEIGYC